MARIRYLKPDFFKDEDLATLPMIDRMTFAGLWCHADREGRLEYRPRYLKAEIWPYDDVDMEAILKHLAAPGILDRPEKYFITIYEIASRQYIQIVEFLKHQKPHHTERVSTIPPPNGCLTVKTPLSDGGNPVGMGMGKGMGKEKKKGKKKTFSSDSVESRLAESLIAQILSRKPDFKKPDVQEWSKHIDLMIEKDKRSPERIRQIIRWCQQDPFWQDNILSTKKLREQFDQLELKMQKGASAVIAQPLPAVLLDLRKIYPSNRWNEQEAIAAWNDIKPSDDDAKRILRWVSSAKSVYWKNPQTDAIPGVGKFIRSRQWAAPMPEGKLL
jgi:hypothetical protein